MPGIIRFRKCSILAAFSVLFFVNGAKASTLEEASDYFLEIAVGSAALHAQLSGNAQDLSVEDLNRGAVATFGRAMSNLDDVLSLADIEDHAYRKALQYQFSRNSDPDRYDFNRDGVATEREITLFFADEAWKYAFARYQDNEDFQNIQNRYEQQLAKLVSQFRDRTDVPDSGDIIVENTTEFTERGLDPLNHRGGDQLPYMAIFDLDKNQAVSFEEFMEPLKSAALRADKDGNGLIDESELTAIKVRSEDLKRQLKEIDGKYGFSPIDTK